MSDSEASAEVDLNAFHELNAFDMMMDSARKKQKPDRTDPIRTAVIYSRRLVRIDPNHPLCGCIYGGQSVRADESPYAVASERWKQENTQAMRVNKRIGLLHELRVHGPEAFDNELVESMRGPQSVVQKWADEREVALIAAHGGPLRDPTVRCKQTLNLTDGGKGQTHFESMEAYRTVCWKQFQDEMEEFIERYGTSLVPHKYFNPVTGYKLGKRLTSVRQGQFWKGHSDEDERRQWLESLPNWAWDATDTEEFKAARSERGKARFASPEARAKQSERAKKQAAREAAEGKPSLVERGKATQIGTWDEEQWEKVLAKRAATAANNRANKLRTLTGVACERQEKRYERADRKEKTRKAKADALLKLEKYTGMDYQWRYRNVGKVQKEDGVHFFKDANGVWCAAFKTQGEGSSSSSGALTEVRGVMVGSEA